jgi:hypothetical protein
MTVPIELTGLLGRLKSGKRGEGEGGAPLTFVKEAAQAKPVPECSAKRSGQNHHGRNALE